MAVLFFSSSRNAIYSVRNRINDGRNAIYSRRKKRQRMQKQKKRMHFLKKRTQKSKKCMQKQEKCKHSAFLCSAGSPADLRPGSGRRKKIKKIAFFEKKIAQLGTFAVFCPRNLCYYIYCNSIKQVLSVYIYA